MKKNFNKIGETNILGSLGTKIPLEYIYLNFNFQISGRKENLITNLLVANKITIKSSKLYKVLYLLVF